MERNTKLTTRDVATAAETDDRIERDERIMRHRDESRTLDRGRTTNESDRDDTPAVAAGDDWLHGSAPDAPSLMKTHNEQDFRVRWNNIQTSFVDEPRKSVEQADQLVAELMQHLAHSFSEQRSSLETQWQRSEQVSTEELRGALRRYRAFFDRLLSVG